MDVVYVACPPPLHAEQAVAGKAIHCEKPLEIDLARSRDLVARVEAIGVANAVNFLYCSARAGKTVIDAIRSGELGELVSIEVRAHLPSWHARRTSEAPWLAHAEACGGAPSRRCGGASRCHYPGSARRTNYDRGHYARRGT
ncbi:MAG: hypothetical protein HOI95_13430 [Chromatiales bacterium]|nr:hypothetical protein [Chromatiales bacterium]